MFRIMKSELKQKYIYLILLFYFIFSTILIFVWSIALGAGCSAVVSFEESLILLIFIMTLFYYQKYNDKRFLKNYSLNSKEKKNLNIHLFLFIFVVGFLCSIFVFCLSYFYSLINFTSKESLTGVPIPLPNKYQLNFAFLFYSILMYNILVLEFAYLINMFIKSKTIICGIIIAIFIIDMRFSWTTTAPLASDGLEEYIVLYEDPMVWSLYLFPWTMIGMRFASMWNPKSYEIFTSFSSYYDLSYMGYLAKFEWLPYVYAFVFGTLILLENNIMNKKSI